VIEVLRQFVDFVLAVPPRPARSANAERSQSVFDSPEEHYKQQNPERSRICNMRWANTTVALGETDFVRCRFFNCKLIADGPFSMEHCFVENCTIRSTTCARSTETSTSMRSQLAMPESSVTVFDLRKERYQQSLKGPKTDAKAGLD